MLRVFGLSDASGDYYLESREADGIWMGRGSVRAGLDGPVRSPRFALVLAGAHPRTGRTLASPRRHVVGFDLTFAAPKSVSLLHGLGDLEVSDAVRRAQVSAVEVAVDYVERRAASVNRRVGDGREILGTGGVTAAAFTHEVSRALDPHLHTHVVMANLGQATDGRWSALDGRALHAHAPAADALYQAHLRDTLSTALGVGWERSGNDAIEVAGIGPEVRGVFSGRRAEIREHLAGRSVASRRATEVAWVVTRPPRGGAADPATLSAGWRDRAAAFGVGPRELASLLGRGRPPPAELDEHRFAGSLMTSPHASATRRDVVRAWSGALGEGAPAREIEGSVDAWVDPIGGLGVAEAAHPLRPLIPPGYVVRAIGGRPARAALQGIWQEAARTIERHRQRFEISDRASALGARTVPAELASLSTPRLAEHLRIERHLQEARRRLGREQDRSRSEPCRSLDLG